MTKTKHTPGPWVACACEDETAHYRFWAKLTPEMLAALELCWQATGEAWAGDCSKDKLHRANAAARAAIAKTEGSAPATIPDGA